MDRKFDNKITTNLQEAKESEKNELWRKCWAFLYIKSLHTLIDTEYFAIASKVVAEEEEGEVKKPLQGIRTNTEEQGHNCYDYVLLSITEYYVLFRYTFII